MISILEKYFPTLKEKLAIDLSVFDPAFLERTITSRMASNSIKSADLYLNNLQENKEEQTELARALNNSYSEFFRNPLTFTYLEQVILPQLIERKKARNENEIRIWSSACASGQEAYSLAILCDELIETTNAKIAYRIFATDICEDEIDHAQKGVYNAITLNKVTLKRIQTYFARRGDTYSVAVLLKEYIDFSTFDLLLAHGACPPASVYGNFDVVFCSNLLFYYQSEYRKRILEKIGNSLAPGGYLVTGESEREIAKRNNFREVFINSGIFQKRQ